MTPPTIRLGLPKPVNVIKTILHRHANKSTSCLSVFEMPSLVTLNCIKLSIKMTIIQSFRSKYLSFV